MSIDVEDFDDADSDNESGDLFGQIVQALSAARTQLGKLQLQVQAEPACAEFSDALYGLLQFLNELDESLSDAVDLDFIEQDQLVGDLAEERAEPIATALREAGAVFQLVPWAEKNVPGQRSDALTSLWEQASDAGWHLYNKLTEIL